MQIASKKEKSGEKNQHALNLSSNKNHHGQVPLKHASTKSSVNTLSTHKTGNPSYQQYIGNGGAAKQPGQN